METDHINDDNEVLNETFGARIQELEKSILEDRKEDKESNMKLDQKKIVIPTSGSLEGILVQAIQAQDQELLETVLAVHDQSVIEDTVSRMAVSYVFPFFELLVIKLEKNPKRGNMLLVWIKALLLKHSSYLMSIPDLEKKMNYLHKLLDNRVKSFKKLQKLGGRIELIMAHVQSTDNGADASAHQPKLNINETETEQIQDEKEVEEEKEEEVNDEENDDENDEENEVSDIVDSDEDMEDDEEEEN